MLAALAFAYSFLILLITAVAVGASVGMRHLLRRIETLERSRESHPLSSGRERREKPLAGLRVALDVRQDHPHAPFAALLREHLLQEDAVVESGGEGLTVAGTLACNGYADVYYRADLAVRVGGETLFTVAERPPHGDRPENLALELVERLRMEWAKRERQGAIRELADG